MEDEIFPAASLKFHETPEGKDLGRLIHNAAHNTISIEMAINPKLRDEDPIVEVLRSANKIEKELIKLRENHDNLYILCKKLIQEKYGIQM
jgi:hypothetical protein